jgi:4-diphosphocytidyl-2-C-methyl-D-erythritol kinase
MARLTVLAPAKVNLCLFLGGMRADGRHELVTVFESISLTDSLSLSVLGAGPDRVVCPGVAGPNLVSAALAGLRAGGWGGPPVAIRVTKRVPVAAGLGGGSADAAAALRLAAALEPVSHELLASVAASVGADVASQITPGVALGTGAGEVVEPLPALAAHAFAILPAGVPLSTAAVYREADRLGLARPADELAALLGSVRRAARAGARLPDELLVNDLQRAAASLHPPIARALADAVAAGADRAEVCGSGPTVAGLFWGAEGRARAAAAAEALSGRYPGACAAAPVERSVARPRHV